MIREGGGLLVDWVFWVIWEGNSTGERLGEVGFGYGYGCGCGGVVEGRGGGGDGVGGKGGGGGEDGDGVVVVVRVWWVGGCVVCKGLCVCIVLLIGGSAIMVYLPTEVDAGSRAIVGGEIEAV